MSFIRIDARQGTVMRKRITRFALAFTVIAILILSGCGSSQKMPGSEKPDAAQSESDKPGIEQLDKDKPGVVKPGKDASDETLASGPYWTIEVSDTKNFTYAIPGGKDGSIDMTATLYFIAWKQGGTEMFGQYEGRALVAFDMDFGNVGDGRFSLVGGVMDDSISDNISFEMLPSRQEAVTAAGEDIDLAPLVKFIGQAEIITEEYTISQQDWKAMADGEVKLDAKGSLDNGTKYSEGFELKAGEDTVLISVGDLAAAYNLDAFRGTITKGEMDEDPRSWFRDKVMSRMEERLSSSEQFSDQQSAETDYGDSDAQNGFAVDSDLPEGLTVDSEGREGIDTNGDGTLEVYVGEDGEVWTDFDGDGKYEIAGDEGADR